MNDAARRGLASAKYDNGAVFVFDLLNYQEIDKTVQEADRKLIGVMHKDTGKYAKTGGWGFEAFAGDSKNERIVKDGGTGCYDCHAQVKGQDYVFTRMRN